MAKDFLELVNEKEAEACRALARGVIISPGAIGDCILMLPLAELMKQSLGLGSVDFIGHTDYIDFYPGRTCVGSVRSIDLIELHRLFAETKEFKVDDRDSLIGAFAGYECIVSFMGEMDSSFESNLIFTVNCSHSAEITILPLSPPAGFSGHISEFYIHKFVENNILPSEPIKFDFDDTLIKASQADIDCGRDLLCASGIEGGGKIVAIAPGGGGIEKCWHLDNFCAIAEALAQKSVDVLFLLGPAEMERFDGEMRKRIQSTAKCVWGLGLTQIIQILACVDSVLGNDSGITHIAGVMGLKTLGIFGVTDPVLYKPIGAGITQFIAEKRGFSEAETFGQNRVIEMLFGMLDN